MLQVKDKDGLTGTASKSVQILAEDDFPPRYVLVSPCNQCKDLPLNCSYINDTGLFAC